MLKKNFIKNVCFNSLEFYIDLKKTIVEEYINKINELSINIYINDLKKIKFILGDIYEIIKVTDINNEFDYITNFINNLIHDNKYKDINLYKKDLEKLISFDFLFYFDLYY